MDMTTAGVMSGNNLNDTIYLQLRARFDSDPDSLSEDEKAAMLLSGVSRLIRMRDEQDALADSFEYQMQDRYNRALLIVEAAENGKYSGDDAYADFRQYLDPNIQERLVTARQFGWAERVNELNCRLGKALGWY